MMIRAAIGFEGSAVEKQPGAPPTAFRIWKAGDVVTDYGVHKFTERSAALLMAEQAERGNRYSIDVDHLSTKDTAPPEARKAVGFHSLAVRASATGPELWAEAAEWTAAVASGLAVDPPGTPEWKYFSPWYDVDKKTGEIVSYKNTALTNNPATHHTTVLASRIAANKEGHAMTYKEAMAALKSGDEEQKKAAMKCIAAAFGETVEQEDKPEDKEKGEKEPKEAKKDAKAAEDKPAESDDKTKELPAKDAKSAKAAEKVDADGDKDGDKATTAALASMGTELSSLSDWKKKKQAEEAAAARATLRATRPDLPDTFFDSVEKLPIAMVEKAMAAIPKSKADPAAALKVQATRGGDGGGEAGTIRAARSPEGADVHARMGVTSSKATIHWDPNHPNERVFPVIDRKEAVSILARRGDLPPPRRPMLADAREVGSGR